MTTPKVDPPKDEVRDKLIRKLVNSLVKKAVYPDEIDEPEAMYISLSEVLDLLGAYPNGELKKRSIFKALIKLQQEALLDRVEKEVIGEDSPEFRAGKSGRWYTSQYAVHHNELRTEQRTTINKLRLKLQSKSRRK